MMYFKNTIAFLGVSLLFMSCLKDKSVSPVEGLVCDDTISFSSEIMPEIFNLSCNVAECHDATTASSGHVFETHEQISPKSDLILRALKHDPSISPTMPFGGDQIVDSWINKFECWINQGKLNN